MLPYSEIRVLDKNSEYHGVPAIRLMENAGAAVADVIQKKFEIRGKEVLVLCGTGNNGGDGFVAARYLSDVCKVKVILAKKVEDIRSRIATKNFARIEDDLEVIESATNLGSHIKNADIILDALLGIGTRGKIREPYRSIIRKVNESKKPVISIDVPSGLGSDLAIRPWITVALHDKKIGQTKENSGEIIVRTIGIPEEAENYVGPGELLYYPIPSEDSHKGDNGRLLVIGGGPFTGAPALVAFSAYKIGADLVHIACPKNVYEVVASFSPSFIVHPLSTDHLVLDDLDKIEGVSENVDAIALGPGLGVNKETMSAVREIIRRVEKPYSIDADGLTAVAKDIKCLRGREGVLTPHSNEFRRLIKKRLVKKLEGQVKQVAELARKTKFTILRKGRVDIISDGKRSKLNDTGNPGMTVGGTGDVLAGIVGGLLSKGVEPYNAARIAAFVSGYAGNLAFKKQSYGMMPKDVANEIPNVLKEFL